MVKNREGPVLLNNQASTEGSPLLLLFPLPRNNLFKAKAPQVRVIGTFPQRGRAAPGQECALDSAASEPAPRTPMDAYSNVDSENNSLLDNTPTSSPVKPVLAKSIPALGPLVPPSAEERLTKGRTSSPLIRPPASVVDILVICQPSADVRELLETYSGEALSSNTGITKKTIEGTTVALRLITSAAQLSKSRLISAGGAIIVCSRPTPTSVAQACEWRNELDVACKVLGRTRMYCVLLSQCSVDLATSALFDNVFVKTAGLEFDTDTVLASVIRAREKTTLTRAVSVSSVTSASSSSTRASGRKAPECIIS